MPDTATPTTLRAVRYEVPLDATDDQVDSLGHEAVQQVADAQHYDVIGGTVRVELDEPSVYADDGMGNAGWFPTSDSTVAHKYGPPTHRTIVWAADVTVAAESVAVHGIRDFDGAVTVMVPPLLTERGGAVRAVHDLGADVTVTALRDNGEQIGYLFATEIDENETTVQVVPNTATLRITTAP